MFGRIESDYKKMAPKLIDNKAFQALLIKIQSGDYTEREYELLGNELTHIFINISYRYNFKDYPSYLKQDSYMLFVQNFFLYGLKNFTSSGNAFSYATTYVFNAFIYTIKKYKKAQSELYNFEYIEERADGNNENFYDDLDEEYLDRNYDDKFYNEEKSTIDELSF